MQADKLQTLIKAAKIDDVEPIWTTLFAKVRGSFKMELEHRKSILMFGIYRLSQARMSRTFY